MATWLGRTVGVHQVRDDIEQVLRSWIEVALVDQTRQSGLDPTDPSVLEMPRSWERAADYTNLAQDQSPNIVVASPRIAGRTARSGSRGRIVDVSWLCHVVAVCRGTTYERTATMVGIYMAAIGTVIDQQLAGGTVVSRADIDDDGEQYDVLAMEDARTIAGGLVRFHAEVPAARQLRRLHDTPPDDPFADAPEQGELVDHEIKE